MSSAYEDSNHQPALPWQELILGGQKSGKTRRAEQAARDWLDAAPGRHAVYLATAQAWDGEMRARIDRHQRDRAVRVPGMQTVEVPLLLAQALQQHSNPNTPDLVGKSRLSRRPNLESCPQACNGASSHSSK